MEIAYRIMEFIGYALLLTLVIDVMEFAFSGKKSGNMTGYSMINKMTNIASMTPLMVIDMIFTLIMKRVEGILKAVVGLISSRAADSIRLDGPGATREIINKMLA